MTSLGWYPYEDWTQPSLCFLSYSKRVSLSLRMKNSKTYLIYNTRQFLRSTLLFGIGLVFHCEVQTGATVFALKRFLVFIVFINYYWILKNGDILCYHFIKKGVYRKGKEILYCKSLLKVY